MREVTIEANGLTFRGYAMGAGPLALCLHGFPDSAHTWRHLLPALADAGFHAVAPFLRGYAPTSVPTDGCYATGALVADVVALHDALGGDADAVLVGHDWGALAAYAAGAFTPDRFRRLVTMAVPPPASTVHAFFTYDQLKRSFYTFLFQTPFAEMAVFADEMAFLDGLWRDWSPGYDGTLDVERAKDCLRDPANLAAAIGYYRALFDPSRLDPRYAGEQAVAMATPPQPTLYLHGAADGCFVTLDVELVAAHLSPESRVEVFEGVGHFLHLERPRDVNARVLAWLAA